MKKQKTKREKLPSIKKLKKQLWELCRQITLNKYKNRCVLCGRKNGEVYKNLQGEECKVVLNVHHFFWNDQSNPKYRFDTDNLVALCFSCHFSVHQKSSFKVINDIKNAIIRDGILTENEIESIVKEECE